MPGGGTQSASQLMLRKQNARNKTLFVLFQNQNREFIELVNPKWSGVSALVGVPIFSGKHNEQSFGAIVGQTGRISTTHLHGA
jgi:hypothetical protein